MFESHFGLNGAPFQLSPDPSFYFASTGHGSALSYMKFGAYQGEGFIVVTGEIGAGKTTLVRTSSRPRTCCAPSAWLSAFR
jgi:type II secretory pathway predicted ATPase ExeA